MVKYVVVMGQGYASNPLLDMRIHDVNVVADLNRLEPDDPVELDGTGTPTSGERTAANVDLTQAMQSITVYWTGWRPLLHVAYSVPIQHGPVTLTMNFHIAKNLIGITEQQDACIEGDGLFWTDPPEVMPWIQENLLAGGIVTAILLCGSAVEVAYRASQATGGLATVALIAAIAVLVTVAVLAYLAPVLTATDFIKSGRWSHFAAFLFLLEIAIVYLFAAFKMDKSQMANTFPDCGPCEIVDNYVISGFLNWLKPSMTAFIFVVVIGAALLGAAIYHLMLSF